MDEKQKIKIHKLIQEIEKKKKLITDKSIKNYIELKKAEGKTISFPEIKNKISENIHKKEYDKEQEKEADLRKQAQLLDEVLSADSKTRIFTFILSGFIILIVLSILNTIFRFSPTEEKDTNNKSSSKTYIKRHIDVVSNSPWDASVYQVEDYLKRTLKDPDSYQSIEWWKVKKTLLGFKVLHKYRAKNSFGGYVVETAEFVLDSNGNVLSMKKVK